ncbi:MAG TPA: glycoside hydrolase family 57 protein, partial [Acidobacteriota bacterium]|nr:glycoside hydrolase family 57 protein [Acidobacteriota bacterium]
MSKKPLCIAFLWHMHQPDYSNMQTGELYLPWTRFHAVKDYYDMAALAAQVPGLRLTINVVPSLMDQLVSYGQGTAREGHAELTLKNAADLNEREKAFLLRAFFQLTWKHMVHPYPRYKELLERRGHQNERGEFADGLEKYTTPDYRDLQVWYNLSWCGRELRKDPEIAALIKKGSGFTEEDKKLLLERQYSFIGRILSLYRKLMEEQGIEISVTPYYHPILPLLCDNRSAREAQPGIHLPSESFSFSSDAREQINRAQRRYQEIFGRAPVGMWPSEGSISDAALALAREAKLAWLASDEGVLANSLQKCGRWTGSLRPEQKFSAQRWGQGTQGPCLFFRDRGLSDLIGFTYSNWKAEDAAADFLSHLVSIHDSVPEDGRYYVVPIILDGENAWEHYPENGAEFLTSLYKGITGSNEFKTVTFSEYLDLEPHRHHLDTVVAGSWIYGNLATWIGHPEKNRAWDELAAARRFLQDNGSGQAENGVYEKAYREMLIAEGSDWFWWYGDDHQSENAAEFDALFRSHVKNVYRLMGTAYPAILDMPIKKAQAKAQYRNPVHTITPRLDGRVSDYFEWLAAGFATPVGGDTMHRAERQIEKVFFGFDTSRFYLRIDLKDLKEGKFPPGRALQVRFLAPTEYFIDLTRDEHRRWHCTTVRALSPDFTTEMGADKIIELGMPLQALGISKPDR